MCCLEQMKSPNRSSEQVARASSEDECSPDATEAGKGAEIGLRLYGTRLGYAGLGTVEAPPNR